MVERLFMKKTETFVEALATILHKQNVISTDEAQAIKKVFYERSQEAFDDFLLSEGLLTRPVLLNALSEYYHVPAFDVEGYFFDHHLLREFPKDFLLRNEIIPLERDENTLIMIASHPNDDDLLPEIGKIVSYDIEYMVGISQDITDAVEEFYDKSPSEVSEDDDLDREHEEAEQAEELIEEKED